MLAKVWTCAVVGLEGELVQVEVDISRQGLVQFNVVGLADTAVQEARERVRAAVRNSGFIFPPRRITVNLAPAEIRKSGPSYDLPIAIGICTQPHTESGSAAVLVGCRTGALGMAPPDGIFVVAVLPRYNSSRRALCPLDFHQEVA